MRACRETTPGRGWLSRWRRSSLPPSVQVRYLPPWVPDLVLFRARQPRLRTGWPGGAAALVFDRDRAAAGPQHGMDLVGAAPNWCNACIRIVHYSLIMAPGNTGFRP